MAQAISAILYISPNTIPQNDIIITDPRGNSVYTTKSVSGNYIKCDIVSNIGTHTISAIGYNTQQIALADGDTKYITMTPASYVSNLSDGTNTYVIKDSEARTALVNKQDTLVSGTNIKTINNNSLLGSGNLNLDGLPSQTGHSGKVLTTDGTTASWQKQYAMVIVDYTV